MAVDYFNAYVLDNGITYEIQTHLIVAIGFQVCCLLRNLSPTAKLDGCHDAGLAFMKKCCKNYKEKKACKNCPALNILRTWNESVRRKDVRNYLKDIKRHPEKYPIACETLFG